MDAVVVQETPAEPDFWDFLPAGRAERMRAACARAVALTEARAWISDCMWADEVDVSGLTDAQVMRGVQAHYDGGWAGFVSDAA